jgi:2-keto-4-pentenoate hydratase/2-oxohepta-3-ene-1,7-dioic acid hydratase in catechol pathway
MATYLIANEIDITRQEGDTADIVFTVPETLSITGATAIFQVTDAKGNIIMTKTPTPVGQVITVPLAPTDTKGYYGSKLWELQITKSGSIYTIGKGNFIIVKERIV